jgi:hypothetical protein
MSPNWSLGFSLSDLNVPCVYHLNAYSLRLPRPNITYEHIGVGLPICYVVWTCRQVPTFRGNILPPYSNFSPNTFTRQETGRQKNCEMKYEMCFPNLKWLWFLCECNFDFLLSFPNIWTVPKLSANGSVLHCVNQMPHLLLDQHLITSYQSFYAFSPRFCVPTQ